MARRLYRSQRERIIGGVAGGLGEYFGIDPVWVRLAFVLLTFASGFGLVAYLVLWVIVPRESSQAAAREAVKENIEDIKQDLKQAETGLREALGRRGEGQTPVAGKGAVAEKPGRSAYLVGLLLIILGVVLLISNLATFWWFNWGRFWPILLILAGVVVLLARRGR